MELLELAGIITLVQHLKTAPVSDWQPTAAPAAAAAPSSTASPQVSRKSAFMGDFHRLKTRQDQQSTFYKDFVSRRRFQKDMERQQRRNPSSLQNPAHRGLAPDGRPLTSTLPATGPSHYPGMSHGAASLTEPAGGSSNVASKRKREHVDAPANAKNGNVNNAIGGGAQNEPAKKHRRGNLPKMATATLMAWLQAHLDNPYPSEDEKITLAIETSLSVLQINNWFINARRRILPGLLVQRAKERDAA